MKLLQLKRLEAESLLDVLRSINLQDLKVSQMCMIARNVMLAQLGVKKILFFYEWKGNWELGIDIGFPNASEGLLDEVRAVKELHKVGNGQTLLQQIGAEYVMPLKLKEDETAYFVIAEFADSEMEAQNDLIFIETLGNVLAVAIRNQALFEEKLEQEVIKRDLEVASTIQQQLLISDFQRFREIDVFGFNEPHRGVGGDFYDIVKRGKGTTFICIADVAGKGISAALLMSNLQANLRTLCTLWEEPKDIVRELNKILFQITGGEKFVTLFLARIDSSKYSLTYTNAGHNHPLLVSEKGLEELQVGSPILGVFESLEIDQATVPFQKGDLLFLYTDGLLEQANASDEMYGEDRIESMVGKSWQQSAKELYHTMIEDLEAFRGSAPSADDITIMCVKFL
ncbi:PP2C family protein-serine/threonine phosphatase [Pontibacter sp. G13]|uniref:PP2C family protein-serine/threonine phosphatase n=1 Tax=Pontibacter sp. G13 TaxID=3074898 RepID=UPI00288A471E|nr:PP2C family protein-serine/threonine phosphatase [Pontibacter sp. G13]WNJ20148.1 PP2C family protein-serine/threonine phosphatase [Pontibacter sp. G13]